MGSPEHPTGTAREEGHLKAHLGVVWFEKGACEKAGAAKGACGEGLWDQHMSAFGGTSSPARTRAPSTSGHPERLSLPFPPKPRQRGHAWWFSGEVQDKVARSNSTSRNQARTSSSVLPAQTWHQRGIFGGKGGEISSHCARGRCISAPSLCLQHLRGVMSSGVIKPSCFGVGGARGRRAGCPPRRVCRRGVAPFEPVAQLRRRVLPPPPHASRTCPPAGR